MLGSFCCEEKSLDDDLVKPAIAAGCKLSTIGEKANLKWLWQLCRKSLEKGDMKGTSLVDDGKPIGSEQYKSLTHLWMLRHAFIFTSYRLLLISLDSFHS